MLFKLNPDQIQRHLAMIEEAALHSLAPLSTENEHLVSRVLASVLNGDLLVMASVGRGDSGEPVVHALGFVSVSEDVCSGTRNLLIYGMYGFAPMRDDLWKENMQCLVRLAESLACHQIVAYSNVPRVIEMTKQLGWDVSNRFMTFPVKSEGMVNLPFPMSVGGN